MAFDATAKDSIAFDAEIDTDLGDADSASSEVARIEDFDVPEAFLLDEEEMEGAKALSEFLESPKFVGIDRFRTDLRNMIKYMMELSGESTGYIKRQVMPMQESSLAMHGVLPEDEIRKRQNRDFWERFFKLMAEIQENFEIAFQYVQHKIHVISDAIDEELEELDDAIEATSEGEADAAVKKQTNRRRNMLLWLKNRLRRHEAKLNEADDVIDVVEVEEELEQDIQDFQNDELSPNTVANRPPSPLAKIGDMLRQKIPAAIPQPENLENEQWADDFLDFGFDDDDFGKPKKRKGSRGESDGESDDVDPPAPPMGE